MPHCALDDCRRWRPRLIVRLAKLGLRVDGDWFCSTSCVTAAADARLRQTSTPPVVAPRLPPLRLGTLLLHAGAVTTAQLNQALRSQASSGLRLGAELGRLGYVDATSVLRALAAQAGASFITGVSPDSVRSAPGGLCAEEVQALGIVPFRTIEDERVVMVACSAPLPRAALRAMEQLTGYRAVPYLVTDQDLDALARAYGTEGPVKARAIRAQWVDGVHNAAQRIADAASLAGEVTVAQARVQPLTWVRVTGKGGIDAMLVTASRTDVEEDAQWLAATTRH